MNVLIYARVSTDKQADKALSIPAQVQAMRDYARQREWSVVDEFIEPGASAKTLDRRALQDLLSRVRVGQERIDVVLAHKIDRIARNVYDYAAIKAFLKERGVRLVSVVENTDDSVSGELVENIMASIAQFYSANLGEEVRKGMRQKVLEGGWPHRPPRGYRAIRARDGVSRIEIHPTEGPLIREAFRHYTNGRSSFLDISSILAKGGILLSSGRPLSGEHVKRMLSNRFYAGRLSWAGITDALGAHEALISPRIFDQVQATMAQRKRPSKALRGASNGFALRAIAICAYCRGNMTASWHRSSNGRRFGYYRCSRRAYDKSACSGTRYCPALMAHSQVYSLCDTLTLSSEAIAKARQSSQVESTRLLRERARGRQHVDHRFEQLCDREQQLTRLFSAGELTSHDYRRAAEELSTTRLQLENQKRNLSQDDAAVQQEVDRLVEAAATIGTIRTELSEERKRSLLESVFEKVVLSEKGMVGYVLRPHCETLLRRRAS